MLACSRSRLGRAAWRAGADQRADAAADFRAGSKPIGRSDGVADERADFATESTTDAGSRGASDGISIRRADATPDPKADTGANIQSDAIADERAGTAADARPVTAPDALTDTPANCIVPEHVLRRYVHVLGGCRIQLCGTRELVWLRLQRVLPDRRASHARAHARNAHITIVPKHVLRRDVRVLGERWLRLCNARELVRL